MIQRKTWRLVPKETTEHQVMLVCAPVDAGRRGTSAAKTYRLYHLKGLKPGPYDVDMTYWLSTSSLQVRCRPTPGTVSNRRGGDGRDERTERVWEFDLYFDIGSMCVMVENRDEEGVSPGVSPAPEEFPVTGASGSRAFLTHPRHASLVVDAGEVEREPSRIAGYPSPTMSSHGPADGITCATEPDNNGTHDSRVGIPYLIN
jgi:hypothetical protein